MLRRTVYQFARRAMSSQSEPRFANGDAAAAAFSANIKGKTILITGGTLGGIGAESATILAKHDPKLLIVSCRTQSKADDLFSEILKTVPDAPLRSILLDTSLMSSTRKAAETINGWDETLDVVIHNAGTGGDKLERTSEGLEMTLATNHVGPFLLTKELLPKMLKSAHAPRIVVVSSGAHTLQPFRFDDLNYERESEWEGEKSYAESKVGGVLFCSALARKWQGRVEAISLTPGAIYTNMVAVNIKKWPQERQKAVFNEDGSIKQGFFISLNEGCRATITAAFDPELPKEHNGAYLNSRAWIAPENQKPPNGIAAHAMGTDLEDRMWAMTEDIIGEKYSP